MALFNDIELMVGRYRHSYLRNDKRLELMDEVDFKAFVYSLFTGRFEVLGFINRSFLGLFISDDGSKSNELVLNIINNLSYSKEDFIKTLNK